jgi:PIN domain nuclease of toxin-antitoxin system
LAYLLEEPGAAVVENALPGALLCAVNLAEVVGKLREKGMTRDEVDNALTPVGFEVVEFDAELARLCGDLRIETRGAGLSLGDRACLALARHRGCEALTTDAAWARLANMRVRLLRGANA